MTEGEFKPTLLEGDEARLIAIENEIHKLDKIRTVITHEGWQGVLAAVEKERNAWIDGLSDPTKLEFKAGVIHGLHLVQDYSKSIERNLSFLYSQKSELIKLANDKEK
jgi:hypothetical protein